MQEKYIVEITKRIILNIFEHGKDTTEWYVQIIDTEKQRVVAELGIGNMSRGDINAWAKAQIDIYKLKGTIND